MTLSFPSFELVLILKFFKGCDSPHQGESVISMSIPHLVYFCDRDMLAGDKADENRQSRRVEV
jgi:hypothetical protein